MKLLLTSGAVTNPTIRADAVKKLVDWQQTYKDQVEKMGAQYEQSVESLVETRQAVAGIWQECKEIPVAMSDLREVLLVNQHQIAELQRHLEAFVTMRDKAIEAVPNIQQKIEEVGELMKLAVSEGRKTNPELKIGICGEHGGHPGSIAFCHKIGLSYVSCSGPRVPIARLAAAQAQLLDEGGTVTKNA